MADWTELDPNGLLPGEPLTSAKALAFFENPVAITEGAADAPRNVLKSIERITAGASLRSTNTIVTSGSATILALGIVQIGTVRVAATRAQAAGTVRIIRRRGGTDTTLATNPFGSVSIDVSVIPGDLISCTAEATAPGQGFTGTFSTGGENLWPAGGDFGDYVNNDV